MSGVLRCVISGGQTGADLGGMVGAQRAGLLTGGIAPKGYRTENGPQPILGSRYDLIECDDPGYKRRTIANIVVAHATVAFRYTASPGTDYTVGYAVTGTWQKRTPDQIDDATAGHRPVLILSTWDDAAAIASLRAFIQAHGVEILNCAGHRESRYPGLARFAARVIEAAAGPR